MDRSVSVEAEPPVAPASVHVVPPECFAEAGARVVAGEIRGRLETRASCSVALAGGSTPRPVYRRLAELEGIDWSRVEVFFGDERAVPPTDPDSNVRMAREALLARVPVPEHRQHRIPAEGADLEEAARAYARSLPAALDLLLLGIGEDGHTASLFPGSGAVGDRERRVVAVEAPASPARRITITPPVIQEARSVVVLASGERKASAVAEALEGAGPVEGCPARLARGGRWVLDAAAAAELEATRRAGEDG